MPKGGSVVARMDRVVDDFVRRCRYFHEPLTPGRARMFAMQHRLNTRQRNSVLKLKVATNCPDWDTRIGIIRACAQEVIADDEHGGGRPALADPRGSRRAHRPQAHANCGPRSRCPRPHFAGRRGRA